MITWLRDEGGAFVDGILCTCPYKGTSESAHVLNPQCEDSRKSALTSRWLCWHSDLRLPGSRAVSSKCLLLISHPVYGTLSQQPEVTVAGWKSELRVSEAQPWHSAAVGCAHGASQGCTCCPNLQQNGHNSHGLMGRRTKIKWDHCTKAFCKLNGIEVIHSCFGYYLEIEKQNVYKEIFSVYHHYLLPLQKEKHFHEPFGSELKRERQGE